MLCADPWLQDEPAQTLDLAMSSGAGCRSRRDSLESIPAAHQIRPYVVCQED
ncbi:MAG: hypothetical protein V8T10_07155 [Merdibacter sp.]